jgi:hypothetical protein
VDPSASIQFGLLHSPATFSITENIWKTLFYGIVRNNEDKIKSGITPDKM